MQAYVCFSAALSVDSKHIDTLLSCGSLYMSCMLLAEAVDVLQRALEAAPDREDIKSRYAASLTDYGRLNPASQFFWQSRATGRGFS